MANQNFKVKKGLEVGTGTTVSVDGINVTGVITATTFAGDGSALTGVTASGTGVVVQEEGSNIGTAATINFIGSNVTAALSGGIANVTVSGGSGGLSNVVEDTTPQLGGNLDLNSKNITGTGNISITGGFNATGVSTFQENVVFESTASFGDNDKINVGTGNDLQIYHDSGTGDSFISESGSGNLKLTTSNFRLRNAADTEHIIWANQDAEVSLYYDNSKKFETTNTGVSVTGAIGVSSHLDMPDSARIKLGTGDDLQIYHDGSNSYVQDTGTGGLKITGGDVYIRNTSDHDMIHASSGSFVKLYHNNSKKLETTGVGVTVFGTTHTQQLNVTGVSTFYNHIKIDSAGAHIEFTPSSWSGSAPYIEFWVGNNSGTHYAQIDGGNAGQLSIHNTSHPTGSLDFRAKAEFSFQVNGYYSILNQSNGGVKLYHPGSQGNILSQKFETTSTGVVITGVATATSFSGSGSALTGLTGASAGTYGASTNTPIITVDSNGRITGIATVATSGAGGGGGISNIVEDTTPQLGGNLDLNSKSITGTGNIEITGYAGVSGVSTFSGAVGFATHIHDAGTGNLDIRSNLLRIKNDAGSETLATFTENGAVSLYHDNALRLATTNTGVSITDNLNVAGVSTFTGNVILNANLDLQDDDKILLGSGDDLEIYHTGSHSFIVDSGVGSLYIRASAGNIQDQGNANQSWLQFNSGAGVEAHFAGNKKFETTNTGVTVTGTLAATAVTGDGSGLTNLPAPGISTASSNVQVNFDVTANGSSAYRFTGPGNDAADDNPDLYLIRGQRYRFTNNSGGSHPFQIRSAAGGSAYSTGVTNNGGASGNIDFNVQHDAPSRLYYQCTSHSAMVGNIYITGGANWQTTSVNTSTAEEIFTLNKVGIGTNNPSNYGGAVKLALNSSGHTGLTIAAGTGSDSNIFFADGVSGDATYRGNIKYAHNGDSMRFHTAAEERLRITSAGNLLVNTATSRSVMDHVGNGPTPKIQIEATNSSAIMSIISAGTADANRCGTINLGRHRNGTVGATPTIVNDNDALGAVVFSGGDGGDMLTAAAKIHAEVDGTPGANDMPGSLVFSTTPDGQGHANNTERIRIKSNGTIQFTPEGATSNPNGSFDTSGDNFRINTKKDGSGGCGFIVQTQNGGALGERLRIDSTGRVLISGQDTLSSTSLTHRLQVKSQNDANAIAIFGRNGDDIGELSFYEADKSTKLGELQYRQDHLNFRHRVGDIRFATGGTTERLRIDSAGNIATNGRAPSSYNNPAFLISGDNATLTIMGDGSTNNSSIAAIKFRVAGATTGDYTKAAIFAKRISGYNDLNMIFAIDNAADANGVNLGNEKMRLTSDGLTFNGDTAAANALDDYEEGSFTATCSNSITLHSNTDLCQYIKIGTLVTVMGQIRVNGSNGGAGLIVGNLPFVAYNAGESAGFSVGSVRLYDADMADDHKYAICIIDAGSNNLIFQGVRDSQAAQTLGATSDAYYMFNITYRTS